MSTHTVPKSVVDRLQGAHMPYELIVHRRTECGRGRRGTRHRPVGGREDDRPLDTGRLRARRDPGSERLDLHKVWTFLGTNNVQLASEETLAGVPRPRIGRRAADRRRRRRPRDHRRADRGLEAVYVEAGTHDQSLRLKTADLIQVDDALLADICLD